MMESHSDGDQPMTNTKPDKPERQTKEQTKGTLGQKEAQLKKDKDLISLTWARNQARPIKTRAELDCLLPARGGGTAG